MKTKIFLWLAVLGTFAVTSCSNTPSYTELKRAEKKVIDRLIASEGFEILKKFPADGVFGEKQFVVLDNGVYLNIVDSGNGNRAVTGKTTVLMRCSVRLIFESDTAAYSTFSNYSDPIDFLYGYASLQIGKWGSNWASDVYTLLSPGVESALEHVGENAVIKLIVPFDEGSSYQTSGPYASATRYGAPIYYDRIRFTFY
jgi:hypothetical protein